MLALGQKKFALSDVDRPTSSGNSILSSCWNGMRIITLSQPCFCFFFFFLKICWAAQTFAFNHQDHTYTIILKIKKYFGPKENQWQNSLISRTGKSVLPLAGSCLTVWGVALIEARLLAQQEQLITGIFELPGTYQWLRVGFISTNFSWRWKLGAGSLGRWGTSSYHSVSITWVWQRKQWQNTYPVPEKIN